MVKKEHISNEELNEIMETSEKLATMIRQLSRGAKKMSQVGLRRETIVLLLHDSCGVGKPNIRAILDALERLESKYTTEPTKSGK